MVFDFDVEDYTKPFLYPDDLVCTTCDFITTNFEQEGESLSEPVCNIYKGQIGEIQYEIEKVRETDGKNNLVFDEPMTSDNIYYSVDFLDLKHDFRSSGTRVFQNLIIQRKYLIPLSTTVATVNYKDKTYNFDSMPKKDPIKVKTELQIERENNLDVKKFKESLKIYNYVSIMHDNLKLRYNLGHMVTVQEVLYEENDKTLENPIIWPGQVGLILTDVEKNSDKPEETVAEVIFLDTNHFRLFYIVDYIDFDIKSLVEALESIYNEPERLKIHREVRVLIKKKYLIPLYAEKLETKNEDGVEQIKLLRKEKILTKPDKFNIYYINN